MVAVADLSGLERANCLRKTGLGASWPQALASTGITRSHGATPMGPSRLALPQPVASNSPFSQPAALRSDESHEASVVSSMVFASSRVTASRAATPAGLSDVLAASTAITLRPGASHFATSNVRAWRQTSVLPSLLPACWPFT